MYAVIRTAIFCSVVLFTHITILTHYSTYLGTVWIIKRPNTLQTRVVERVESMSIPLDIIDESQKQ